MIRTHITKKNFFKMKEIFNKYQEKQFTTHGKKRGKKKPFE